MRAAVLTAKQSIKTVDQTTRSLFDTEVKVQIRAGGICGSDLNMNLRIRLALLSSLQDGRFPYSRALHTRT